MPPFVYVVRAPLTLSELSERSQTPARTIRFYIARGLLPGPLRAGRGAFYTKDHLERVAEIRRLQAEGRMLAEISAGTGEAPQLAEPQSLWRYSVAPDVEVTVRDGISPWRMRLIRSALSELARKLNQHQSTEEGESHAADR